MTQTCVLKTKRPLLFKYAAAVIAVMLTIAAFAGSCTAFAQDATAAAASGFGQWGPHSQGPEGSWLYTVTIPGYTFQGIETYAAGGGYSEADQLSFTPDAVASAGHGAWKMTGERTFLLTYLNLTFDSFTTGNATGTLIVRQTTKLDSTGNSYKGSGDYTYYDLKGNPIPSISGTFTITAKRILVQAPKK